MVMDALPSHAPIEALRLALKDAEVKAWGGRIPSMMLGQALLMLGNDWEPAARDQEAFVQSFTPIERHLAFDVAQLISQHMQDKAGQAAFNDLTHQVAERIRSGQGG